MKHLAYAAAAALSVAGLGLFGCERDDGTTTRTTTTTTTVPPSTQTAADDMDRAGDRAANAADNAGEAIKDGAQQAGEAIRGGAAKVGGAAKDLGRKVDGAINRGGTVAPDGTAAAPDAEGIRDILATVAEAALTKGGLDDLTERLVDADRNRIGPGVEAEFADLDGRIDQFRKDWKAKYNADFDITDEEAVYPNNAFMITQSEIPEGAAGVDVDVDNTARGAEVDVDANSGVDQPGTNAADTNRNDPGRNTAKIQVAASHGLPAMTINMIHEAPDNWKIDVPNTLTAAKLKQNVLAHLTAANQMKAQWPADVNQAHAAVTHHVLMALMDMPVRK